MRDRWNHQEMRNFPESKFYTFFKRSLRFFQTTSKTKQNRSPEILSNYFKNQTQGVPEIFSNYFKNKIQRVPEIISTYFKIKNRRGLRDFFKRLQRPDRRERSARFFQTM